MTCIHQSYDPRKTADHSSVSKIKIFTVIVTDDECKSSKTGIIN